MGLFSRQTGRTRLAGDVLVYGFQGGMHEIDMHIGGFDDAYTYLDFYPAQQADGTISAPVLFKNIQRTWEQRQTVNNVKVHNSFLEAVAGAQDWDYYFRQAELQYLQNSEEKVDVVVFGHTHVPDYEKTESGKYFVNDGTWIDHNTDYPEISRSFAVITTGEKDTAALYSFGKDYSAMDVTEKIIEAKKKTTEK